MGFRAKARKQDPRDARIRSLEAEHRIAQTDAASLKERVGELEKELEQSASGIEKRDNVISHQQDKIEQLNSDLKDSVAKTRELRTELSDRATENIRSEVKLREVETELEVAQASTDMIATGVLDYSMTPDVEEEEGAKALLDEAEMTKSAT